MTKMRLAQTIIIAVGILLFAACSDKDEPVNIEPELFTTGAMDITRTEATVTGSVVLSGDADIPTLYFVYGTTEEMTQTSAVLEITDSTYNRRTTSLRLTGLTPGTQYYYCLRGCNSRVILDGGVKTFTTEPNDKPTVSGLTLLSRGPVSVIVSYEITDNGGEPVTETGCIVTCGGVVNRITTTPPAGTGKCKLSISGLQQGVTYQLNAFAANRSGETVGETMEITTDEAVALSTAGQLEMLMGDDPYSFTSLSFAGPMNGDDLRFLRRMMGRDADGSATQGRLSAVNITDVTIVEGGGSYGSSRYTADNVVGYGLFADCQNLTTLVLPNAATVIEEDAFANCSSLKTLVIPANAQTVVPSSGCTSLADISVSAANASFCSIDGVLFNGDAGEIVWFPMGKTGDYILPSTVKSIGDYAFMECSITSFTLPDELTEIGQAAFYGSMVEEVNLPAKLRLIPTATFQNCLKLTTVRLGEQTEYISDYAFDGCPLTDIYIEAAYPPVCTTNAFTTSHENLFTSCTLHVPVGRRNMYKADKKWGLFKNIVEE